MTSRLRTVVAAVLVALVAVTLAVPAGARASGHELERRLERSRSELRDARVGLAATRTSIGETRRRVTRLDARLGDATRRLGRLEGELERKQARLEVAEVALGRAQRALEAAEAESAAATAELRGATQRLAETQDALVGEQDTLDAQAAAVYRRGGPAQVGGLLSAVFHLESPSDAALGVHLVESVVSTQKATIERIGVLEVEAEVHRRAVAAARDRALAEEAAAREVRSGIADLTAQRLDLVSEVEGVLADQARLVGAVRTDQETQQRLLRRLEADRAAYAGLVDELEAESSRLGAELAARAARQRARRGGVEAGAPGRGQLVWPTSGPVTSRYGYRTHPVTGQRRLHTGIDIGAPTGRTVVAAAAGDVIHAGWRGGYGLTVIVDHGGGLATLYAHQSSLAVRDGERVARGERIGSVGSTGMSTGPHLHFEVRVDGRPRDPLDWY